MFKFYLRQTVPFNIADLFKFPALFFTKNSVSVNQTEKIVSRRIGTKFCVVTSSMRLGMVKSLEYYKKRFSDKKEVILPEYSFHSNLSSVLSLGLKVKYVPVNPQTLEIDLKELPKFITDKTLAIIITHIHGLSYPMDQLTAILRKKRIILFEDCAHAFGQDYKGKKLGSSGVGCFSFGPGKNITGLGGGAICTQDSGLYSFLKSRQKVYKNGKDDVKVFLKAICYTLISNPFISFLTMKPLLGVTYILNIKKIHNDEFSIAEKNPKEIKSASSFQLRLICYQLNNIYPRIEKIITKRKKIAQIYSVYFNRKINSRYNFCFQYPLCASDANLLIKKSWLHNLDLQYDYCSYLPDLHKANKLNSSFREKIIYLPVNYHLSLSDLTRKLIKIFR